MSQPDTGAGLHGQMRRGSQRLFGGTFGQQPKPDVIPPTVFVPPVVGWEAPAPGPWGAPGPAPDLTAMRSMFDEMAEAMLAAMSGGRGTSPRTPPQGISAYDATLAEPGQSTPEISTNELRAILARKSGFVFDGRTRFEYSVGHIPGAINVAPKPGVAMSQYVSDAAEIERVTHSRDAPVVLYCNGPFCGKSRRLGDDLVREGFTNVRRYQLGTPTWRALVGMMVIEAAGVRYVANTDKTAVFVDARNPTEFTSGSLPGARNVPLGNLIEAKDDGRLPMDDFNTRVVVFGRDPAQAHGVAEALVQQGFNNVRYFDGTFPGLVQGVL